MLWQGELFFDVGKFEADAFRLVDDLQQEAEQQGGNTEARQHDERRGVVELGGIGDSGIGGVEHLADEQGEEPQADVLNPENEGVGRADDLGVDELRNAGPQGGGHEREAGAENKDGGIPPPIRPPLPW